MLSEKKFLNETKNHNRPPPFQVKWSVPNDLTKKQRESNNALHTELSKIKKDFPTRSWAIHREKIVELRKSGIPPWAPDDS